MGNAPAMEYRLRSRLPRLFGRKRVAPGRSLPPGVDEVRLLTTPEADALAEWAATLATVDQALGAMRLVIARRQAPPADPLADIALLQFALTQFVSCFKARKGVRRLTPKQAFDAAGARHFEHVAALADQLSGAQPRLTGRTEVVVLLKRADDQAAMVGLTTRTRIPDRLTVQELSGIAEFMALGREAYAAKARQQREAVVDQVTGMSDAELLARGRSDQA